MKKNNFEDIFENSIFPRLFRQRYLYTHAKYLKSIADIATYLYFKKYNRF
ncbi:unnamed protein product [marine sediment metagenome]|uniref:Uncharacterized protein n=1 Tax=marine sediment metagenome TaxID=412755 RepID=X1HNH3_9ZZZZ